MTTLDLLARSSADAIRDSVASVPVPSGGISAVARGLVLRRSVGYALAGAAAAVVAVVAMLLVAPPVVEVTDTPTTVVIPTTTVVVPTVEPPSRPDVPVLPIIPPEGVDRTHQATPDTTADIVVDTPADGTHTTDQSVTVAGTAEVGATVVTQDDVAVPVDSSGAWHADIALEMGENLLVFRATDAVGNLGYATVRVFRDPPPTTTTKPPTSTTTTTKPGWEFSAHKTYGSCSENPPYDIYYGTGKPGTEIIVTSEFGGGTVEVDGSGEWSVKVFFPEAPPHAPFTVKVKHFDGSKKTFEFVYSP
ncbi:MAG: hypothetical protein R2823_08950 [Acidimicrobiia bacterium]